MSSVLIDGRRLGLHGIGRYIHGLLSGISQLPDSREISVIVPARETGYSLGALGDRFRLLPVEVDSYSASSSELIRTLLSEGSFKVFHSPHQAYPVDLECAVVATVHDAIHTLFPGVALPDGSLAARLGDQSTFGMRSQLRELADRGGIDLTVGHRTDEPLGLRYARGILDHAMRRSDVLLAVSHTAARDFRTVSGYHREVVVTANGSKRTALQPLSHRADRADGTGTEVPYALAVLRDAPHKNLGGLLRAFADARQKTGDLSLVVVGCIAPSTGALSQLLDGVYFIQDVEERRLEDLYSSAHVVVVPSLYEGFGLPALEAMEWGVPVVAWDGGAMREVCAGSAWFARSERELSAGIVQATVDSGLRQALSHHGIARASAFSWVDTAQMTLRSYDQALSRYRSCPQRRLRRAV